MMEGIGAFEVVYGSVDGLVNYLEELGHESDLPLSLDSQVQSLKLELRFLGTMLRCTEMKQLIEDDDCDLLDHVDAIIEAAEVDLSVINDNLQRVISYMLDEIKGIQPELRISCIKQLESTKCIKSSNNYVAVVELVDSVLADLDNLLNYKWELVGHLKEQIEALEEKFIFLKATLQFTANRCVNFDRMNDLLNYVVIVARNASCLSYLCWVDEINESMESQMEIELSDLLGRMMPMMNPEVREVFIGAMKASKSEQSDTAMNEKLLVTFIDSLLYNLMVLPSSEALVEDLRFLRAFLEDLPSQNIEAKKQNDLLTHIEGVISDMGWVTYSSSVSLVLQEKVSFIKTEVRKIYIEPLQSMFRNTDLQTVFDHMLAYVGSVIKKLKQFSYYSSKRIAFAKREIETIQENLKFMRISNWEDCYEAYQAEHVINSFVVRGGPIWYHLLCHVRDLVSSGAGPISIFHGLRSHTGVDNQQMDDFREIVGFDNDRGVLIYHLTGRLKRRLVVWISGISGTGKTMLAKAIFHDPQIGHHFHYFVWLNISEIYHKVDMLHEILNQISEHDTYEMSEEDLSLALYRSLKRCRYLIVMDDLWDPDLLKFLTDVLPDDANGSRILVTSRNYLAHSANLDTCVHHLCPLSCDESWSLLQRKLNKYGECCPAEICSIGEQIAKDCKGHPLAILCVSQLLAKIDKSWDSWRQVGENLHSYLLSDQRMKLILEGNYKQLPDYLKHCFLYLGAFWQENGIPASKLIRLWVAEGFIELNNQNSPEDEAKAYLTDLIDRNLVIVTKRATNGWIKAVRVHDYFHDICVAKAREEKCWQLIQRRDESHRRSYDQKKLCIYSRKDQFLRLSSGSRHLDSLLFFATDEDNSTELHDVSFICSRFKRLRVLDLEHINIGSSLPDGIELLVQLRYLAIQGAMTAIPPSIAKLLNLETFILNGSKGHRVGLPNTIWKMVRLRHLRLNCPVAFSLFDYNAKDSSQLENLITFYTLPLPLSPDMKKILGRFPQIQKLRCVVKYSRDSASNYQWFPDLELLSHLESLKLSSHGKLQYDNISFPITLRKLVLSGLGLPWNKISTITGLPNLQVLKLLSGSFKGQIWYMNDMECDGFYNLRFLKLSNLNIEQWYADSEFFTSLQRLVLQSCTKLERIPDALGEISTLEMIEVECCNESVASSAMQILDEQQDMGNMVFKVIVNNAS